MHQQSLQVGYPVASSKISFSSMFSNIYGYFQPKYHAKILKIEKFMKKIQSMRFLHALYLTSYLRNVFWATILYKYLCAPKTMFLAKLNGIYTNNVFDLQRYLREASRCIFLSYSSFKEIWPILPPKTNRVKNRNPDP